MDAAAQRPGWLASFRLSRGSDRSAVQLVRDFKSRQTAYDVFLLDATSASSGGPRSMLKYLGYHYCSNIVKSQLRKLSNHHYDPSILPLGHRQKVKLCGLPFCRQKRHSFGTSMSTNNRTPLGILYSSCRSRQASYKSFHESLHNTYLTVVARLTITSNFADLVRTATVIHGRHLEETVFHQEPSSLVLLLLLGRSAAMSGQLGSTAAIFREHRPHQPPRRWASHPP